MRQQVEITLVSDLAEIRIEPNHILEADLIPSEN
jgi:hypothetical protein